MHALEANKRHGSERSVDGFYINDDGDFLIARIVNQSGMEAQVMQVENGPLRRSS